MAMFQDTFDQIQNLTGYNSESSLLNAKKSLYERVNLQKKEGSDATEVLSPTFNLLYESFFSLFPGGINNKQEACLFPRPTLPLIW